MTGLWKSFTGMIRIRITSGALTSAISKINHFGIALMDVTYVDELTIEATIYRCDYRTVNDYISRCGHGLKIIKRLGIFWSIKKLLTRPLLVLGLLIYLLLALYLPTRILFVRVDGNTEISTNLILENAEKCGIGFGESRRQVRSERVKNMLLAEIPELQWVGVNTYGCVAVISVKERSITKQEASTTGVSNIIAIRDGVITEVSSSQGTLKCRVGQAVKAGQILVSGYVDCGIVTKATRAHGEIFASTLREITVKTPGEYNVRASQIAQKTKYCLQIGKKLINLSQDSGISPSTCVKMYERKQLALPGGFKLPVSLIIERVITNKQQVSDVNQEEAAIWVKRFSRDYLQKQMIAGSIISCSESVVLEGDEYCLYGRYFCREMIGQERHEEIIHYNG